MHDQFEVDLVDDVLLEEVRLTTDLMVAAVLADGPLPWSEVDRILGVLPAD